jgi:hypothetical protein
MELSPSSKGILFCQLRTERLHVVLTHATSIHPEPQRLVTHKLRRADGFINGALLNLIRSELVFEDQHADPVCGQLPDWPSPARLCEKGYQQRLAQPGDAPLLQIDTGLLNVFSI